MRTGIVLFGGAGYIGSNLAVGLRDTYRIIIIDKVKKPEWFDLLMPEDAIYYQYDLTLAPKQNFKFELKDVTYGILLAALKDVLEGESIPFSYARENLAVTTNSVEICDIYNITNIIFSSSCTVYHTRSSCLDPKPKYKEEDGHSPDLPYGVYGVTKKMSEDLVRALHWKGKIAILRYFNPIGSSPEYPLFPPEGVFSVLAARPDVFVNRGNGLRDYININYMVSIHRLLLQSWPYDRIIILNVGTGNETRTEYVAKLFQHAFRREGHIMKIVDIPRPQFEAPMDCADLTYLHKLFPQLKEHVEIPLVDVVEDYVHRFNK